MQIAYTPADITREDHWNGLLSMVSSRMSDTELFDIDLSNIGAVDLAQFNALLMLAVKVKRVNKKLTYRGCTEPTLTNLINKTKFDHVFTS